MIAGKDAWDDIPGKPDYPGRGGRRAAKDPEPTPDWLYLDRDGKPQAKDRCGAELEGRWGCAQWVEPRAFNLAAGLCLGCSTKLASSLDIPFEWVSYLLVTWRMDKWLFDRIPLWDGWSLRTRQRIALLAAGVPVRKPTSEERDGATYLRDSIPCFAMSAAAMSAMNAPGGSLVGALAGGVQATATAAGLPTGDA